jgi:hypothetical protein
MDQAEFALKFALAMKQEQYWCPQEKSLAKRTTALASPGIYPYHHFLVPRVDHHISIVNTHNRIGLLPPVNETPVTAEC